MEGVGDGWEVAEVFRDRSDWTWFKIRGGKVLKVVLLSRSPVWYAGHFHKGRMVPCGGNGCRLCHERVGTQVRYVFGAARVEDGQVGLLEVGKSIGLQIRDWIARRGQLHGMSIALTKQTLAKQSRTEIEYVEGQDPEWLDGTECPDVRRALESTWDKMGFSRSEHQDVSRKTGGEAKEERVRFKPPGG